MREAAVCRRRGTPVLTFVNKMDRTAPEPLEILDDLEEKHDLTREDVVKHAYPDLRNSSNVINQNVEVRIEQLGRALSDQASRAKRKFKELNDGKLEHPIRLYTKRGGAWDQYALTYVGRPGEGNKYGIIKASLSTDQS